MQKRLPALFLVFCFFVHRTHAKVAATVDIKHDPCTRTITCITNGSNALTWEANDVIASLWRGDKFKTMNIGQGGSANVTLIAIEDIPNGMMQSTFVVLSPGSFKSLTVMCMTDDGTNKTFSVQMEGCPSSVSSDSGSASVTTPSVTPTPTKSNADSGLSTANLRITLGVVIGGLTVLGVCCSLFLYYAWKHKSVFGAVVELCELLVHVSEGAKKCCQVRKNSGCVGNGSSEEQIGIHIVEPAGGSTAGDSTAQPRAPATAKSAAARQRSNTGLGAKPKLTVKTKQLR